MDVNVSLKVPALEKLVGYTASGIGGVAGAVLAPWKARKQAEGKRIAAEGDADVLQIHAAAQARARGLLVSEGARLTGELNISETVNQRIQFQEEKRQINMQSVVRQAAAQLVDKTVTNSEPDHDWTARFFNEVQDVSSEEMQALWARVLAGQVERPGSTSIRTLGILRNLDHSTASLFRLFCSACVFLHPQDHELIDARVPSLGGNPANNALQTHGFSFGALNRLDEHGLIISDYNSWLDYRMTIGVRVGSNDQLVRFPFRFQDRHWILLPDRPHSPDATFKLSGVALTWAGRELSEVVDVQPLPQFTQELIEYFKGQRLLMSEVSSSRPILHDLVDVGTKLS